MCDSVRACVRDSFFFKQPEICPCALADAPSGINENIIVKIPFDAFKKTPLI